MFPEELLAPNSYRQLSQAVPSADFCRSLDFLLEGAWAGAESAHLRSAFYDMCAFARTDGATSLAGILPQKAFDDFRVTYDMEMRRHGSRGALHNYLDLASSDPLLTAQGLWDVVADPLLVAVISYVMGGAVVLVDLRAKDTAPLDVVARDNTLHLDNSPFMDEYKIITSWTIGTNRGPSGQGLTYLPGTNQLFRQCYEDQAGEVWSEEDACIFPTRARVDEALAAQARAIGKPPVVVHLTDMERPCHTVLAASRLVHHRYRTADGAGRSAVMAAYHRTEDSVERLGINGSPALTAWQRTLVEGASARQFLAALETELPSITTSLARAMADETFPVNPLQHTLAGEQLTGWYERQSRGVSLNALRVHRTETEEPSDAVGQVARRLLFDLQGPLNMPFFADLHEADRKRARIWLRELAPEEIRLVVEAGTAIKGLALEAHTEGPRLTSDDQRLTCLKTCVRDLSALLQSAPEADASRRILELKDRRGPAALAPFVDDLRRSVGWLDPEDGDSVVTATAFALVAAVVGSTVFDLADGYHSLIADLLDLYKSLTAGQLDWSEAAS